jgi:signal transduction histidine kinase/ActR/RegA family two-component response regulator
MRKILHVGPVNVDALALKEICERMCQELRARPLTVLVVNLITVSLIWHDELQDTLAMWFVACALAQFPRWRLAGQNVGKSISDPTNVYRRLFWLTLPIAFAQASIVPLTWFHLLGVDQFVLTLVILGLCVGGVVSVPGHVHAYVAYLLAMLGCVTVAWLATGGRQGLHIGFLLVLLGVVLVGFSRRLRQQIASLVEQREKVRLSTEARSRFFAAANHDLRQPLQGVNMYAAALSNHLTRGNDPAAQEICAQLQRGLVQSGQLLDALLDISRLDADVLSVKPQPVHLQTLFDALREEFEPQVVGRDFELRFGPCFPAVESDPVILQRILRNLISNAVKFTESGFVRIGVDEVAQPSAGFVAIYIEDSGVGIAPEHLDKVFEEFYQVNNPARTRDEGLGLGLAIVRRLCDKLGHQIVLASRPGVGTVVRLQLPLAKSSAQASEMADAAVLGALPERVLVLDDEEEVAQATAQLCSSVGIDTRWTSTVAQARRIIEDGFVPQAVIADERLRSPNSSQIGSGTAFCAELMQSMAPLHIIILTGETSPAAIAAIHRHGFAVVFKPARGDTLLKLLRQEPCIQAS